MDQFKTEDIYRLLLSQWKKLAIVALISIVVGAVVSSPWIMKPKYKSIAVVFPTNLNPYSEESTTEQLLQFFNSEEVKNNLAERFDLYHYYGIDTADAHARSNFNFLFQENFKASNTLYESIEIEVMDHSPARARQLAQGMIDEVNSLVHASKKATVGEYLKSYRNQLLIKQTEIDSIEAKLKDLRLKYGLLDVRSQVKELSKRTGKGGMSEDDKLLLTGLREKSGTFEILQGELKQEIRLYRDLKKEYDKNMLDYNSHISFTTVVSRPSLPDKKCYPVRWAIVSCITLSALLLASLIIIVSNKKRNRLA